MQSLQEVMRNAQGWDVVEKGFKLRVDGILK